MKIKKKDENVQKLKEAQNAFNEGKKIMNTCSSEAEIEVAIEYFTKAIDLLRLSSSYHNASKFFSSRGNAYMKVKKFEEAEKDFNNAIAQDGKNSSSYLNSLGKCKLQMSESIRECKEMSSEELEKKQLQLLKEALDNFDSAIQINSSDGNCYLNRAYVYNLLGRTTNAIQDYGKALSYLKEPDQQFKAHYQRGIAYRTINQLGNSIDDLVKACDHKREDVLAHINLGISYFEKGNYEESLATYDRAISLDSKNPEIYNYKARALFHNGNFGEALSQFDKAIKIYRQKEETEKLVECRYNKGNTLITLGDIPQALEELSVGVELTRQSGICSKLHYSIGLCYEKIGNSLRSMEQFQESLRLNSENLMAIYHLGINQFRAGRLSDAQRSFTKLLDKGANEICVLEARGTTFFQMQKYKEALQDYQNANRIDENHSEVLILIGLALNQLGQTSESLTYFFKALSLGSKNPVIYNGVGQAYRMKKQYDKALFYFNIALEIKPESDEFLIERSQVFLDINEFVKAIEDLTKALGAKPEDSLIHYKRGLAYYRNNEFKKCIDDLYIAFKKGPLPSIEPDIHYHLGISLQNLEEFEKAIPPLTKAISLAPLPHYFHERAKCYLITERYKQALDDLNVVIAAQPSNAYAYFRRAFAFKALKSFEASAEDFARARQLDPRNSKLIINKKHIYEIKYIKLCNAGEEMR